MTLNRREMMIGGAGLASASVLGMPRASAKTTKPDIPTGAVVLVAELTAKPGEQQAVREALMAMVEPTRKEAGCLCYNLHQSVKDPATFMFYEQWASQAALDAHSQSAHMRAMRAATKGKIAKGGVKKFHFIA